MLWPEIESEPGAAQPEHGPGDLRGFDEPAHRVVRGERRARLLGAHRALPDDGVHAPLEERGLREPRTHRVDGDPGLRELQGKGSGEPHDPVLRGAVGGHVGVALETGGGCDRDEPPPPRFAVHSGEAVPERAVAAGEVHVDHLRPRLRAEPCEGGARGLAGIGDDDARRTPLASRPLERGAEGVVVGHVRPRGMQPASRPGREPLQDLEPPPEEGDPGPLGRERLRDGGADSRSGAGDDRVGAFEERHGSGSGACTGPGSGAGSRSGARFGSGPGPGHGRRTGPFAPLGEAPELVASGEVGQGPLDRAVTEGRRRVEGPVGVREVRAGRGTRGPPVPRGGSS